LELRSLIAAAGVSDCGYSSLLFKRMAPTRFLSPTLLVKALHAGSPIQNDLVTGTMSVAMRGKGRFLNVLTVEPGRSEIGDQLSVAEILEARRDFEIFSADKLDHAL